MYFCVEIGNNRLPLRAHTLQFMLLKGQSLLNSLYCCIFPSDEVTFQGHLYHKRLALTAGYYWPLRYIKLNI